LNPSERQLILSSPAPSVAHPGSYSMGTGVLAGDGEGGRRIKRPGSEVNHATSSRAEVKNE